MLCDIMGKCRAGGGGSGEKWDGKKQKYKISFMAVAACIL